MNQDLVQMLTNADSLVNSIRMDVSKVNASQIDELKKVRNEMEAKIDAYNASVAKANENVRKDLETLYRKVEQQVKYIVQPPQ